MSKEIYFVLGLLLLLTGCASQALPPVAFQPPEKKIDYLTRVEPILVKRCVVCHSCYNSPCQLKLSSFEGLERGATKKAVYNSKRLHTMQPTRLFMDAETTTQWRYKGFYNVTANTAGCGKNNSTMMQLLDIKRRNPIENGDTFYPEAEDLTCAETDKELGSYLKKHPNRGMPFGFPPLEKDEFETIAGWLGQGAQGPDHDQQVKLKAIPKVDQEKIKQWESFLNKADHKHILTARYLYEHLFLAHIAFDTEPTVFYELVRSKTAPGEAIDIIATDLPYDKPPVDRVYYRFRKIHSTIVHKTHMVFTLTDDKLSKYQELFIDQEWLLPAEKVGYGKSSANPFLTFEQIPTRSRYRFLLDNIHYIIMTFIRGPVCKGQVALNVIQDHFWLLFLDPDFDLTVKYPGFLSTYGNLLEMPSLEQSDGKLVRKIVSRDYREKSTDFAKVRSNFYATIFRYSGFGAEGIWPGNDATDTPLLTVFRHFDSASVHKGPLGNLPRTIWVMDYPLVERIYYSLVAGFNVYGSAVHQLATRVYMDELRQEGETYFLDFMPKPERKTMMKDWYGGMDIDKEKIDYTPSPLDAGFTFITNDPKREFIEYLMESRFLPEIGMTFDENYLKQGEDYPSLPTHYSDIDDYIQGFRAISRPGVSFFTKVDDHNANLAYVRIKVDDNRKNDVFISMVINRYHDDVTTLFGEELRLRPENDGVVFIKGFVGSYPNYFVDVELKDFPDFLKALQNYDGCPRSVKNIHRFGINRADPKFWEIYDEFQDAFNRSDPIKAGVFDLNRYYYLAIIADKK